MQAEAEDEIKRAFHQENFSTHFSIKKIRIREVSRNPILFSMKI